MFSLKHLNTTIKAVTANHEKRFSIRMSFLVTIKRCKYSSEVSVDVNCVIKPYLRKMSKQIAQVNWSRGRYSDVVRTAIVDPSPIKQGQKVRVIWGKGKKEYSATITCYPLIEEIESPVEEPQPRQTTAKRKLVSTFSHFIISSSLSTLTR